METLRYALLPTYHASTYGSVGQSTEAKLGAIVFPLLGMIVGPMRSEQLDLLRSHDLIEEIFAVDGELNLIEPVEEIVPLSADNDWIEKATGIDILRARGLSGRGIKVCHLDTGVDVRHPALVSANIESWRFESDGSGHLAAGGDTHGHGTHTAGIIVGQTGMAPGIARNAQLYSGSIIGSRSKVRLLAGFEWALSHRVDLVNLSMGVDGYDGYFEIAIGRLLEAGILSIVAIGNDGPSRTSSPGNYANALGVGAVGPDMAVWESSGSGASKTGTIKPDLVAPGVGIYSSHLGGGVKALSGTSQATPIVTAICCLLLEANPRVAGNTLLAALLDSADLRGASSERAGRGLVHGEAALRAIA